MVDWGQALIGLIAVLTGLLFVLVAHLSGSYPMVQRFLSARQVDTSTDEQSRTDRNMKIVGWLSVGIGLVVLLVTVLEGGGA